MFENLNLPVPYGMENVYNSARHPSKIHVAQAGLTRYFERYLVQKIISVFKFDGIPENWVKEYFYYCLVCFGFVGVIETREFGIIPQWCTLKGRGVQYEPTNIVISNPLLRGLLEPRIGIDCALIKMQPDYGGAWDIVSFYADMLSLSAQTAATNLINSKLAYVFITKNKQSAESLKKLYDRIASGDPAAFVDEKLFDVDGTPLWQTFSQNLSQNYIAGDILEDMTKWDARFCTDIGIPNVNVAKESGVSDREVESNNDDTKSKVTVWKENIQEGLDMCNRLFGTNITVRLRWEGGDSDARNDVDNGSV